MGLHSYIGHRMIAFNTEQLSYVCMIAKTSFSAEIWGAESVSRIGRDLQGELCGVVLHCVVLCHVVFVVLYFCVVLCSVV